MTEPKTNPENEIPDTIPPQAQDRDSYPKMPHPPKSLEDSFLYEVVKTVSQYHSETKRTSRLLSQNADVTRSMVEQIGELVGRVADSVSTLTLTIERASSENTPSLRPLTGTAVLIVDDARDLSRVLSAVLSDEGARAESVLTGMDAKRALAAQAFDVALVDVKLGDMSGVDLATYVLEEHPGVNVVIMTGFLGAADSYRIRELGLEVLEKPVNTQSVIDAVMHARESSTDL